MRIARAISWDDSKRRRTRRASLACLLAIGLFSSGWPRTVPPASVSASVIVRAEGGLDATAANAVKSAGGTVVRRIGVIDALVAVVPAAAVPRLQHNPAIAEVTTNFRAQLFSDSYDQSSEVTTLSDVAGMDGAHTFWNAGYTGQGVDVALVDSGVVPVPGLTTPGKVINGPDLSLESQNPSLRYLDTFGHGTHMAGIIAGRDQQISTVSSGDTTHFLGMAPSSRIVSIKVADGRGQTDVSQMLAAIDWVVQHRTDDGLNIRVLNLSFGTDSTQSYQLDPLAYAAEQAWKHGIVVVVSAGNNGPNASGLDDPAIDPYVVAVGASNSKESASHTDRVVAAFTSLGSATRGVDVMAPGVHIASLRDPGSFLDQHFPSARFEGRYFLGSGTSQAAAIVSGAAALLISQRPAATPDQIKALLLDHARAIPGNARLRGAGELALGPVLSAPVTSAVQRWAPSSGTGSLDAARGGRNVQDASGAGLTGERDIFGDAITTGALAKSEANGAAWRGGFFNRALWSEDGWTGASWSGPSWGVPPWTDNSWSGRPWVLFSPPDLHWTGSSWAGSSWSGSSWSGSSWSGSSWSAG